MNRSASSREMAATGEIGALRWALLQRSENAAANHLLIVMGWRANKTFESYMSAATMAAETGLHKRTVKRKIKFLLERGFITDITHLCGINRPTKTYRLNAPIVDI